MKRLAILLVLVAAALAVANHNPPHALAAPTVCPSGCAFSTIQAAINAATPGQTITVAPGCYFENLDIEDIPSPGITISSTNGPGPHTVSTNPANDFFYDATDPCFASPFTTYTGTYIDGGCDSTTTVYIYNAFVTIGGVTIQDGCIFDASDGGGVHVDEFSSVQLANDWIFANFSEDDEDAAGVFVYYDSSLYMVNDVVENNFNDDYSAGGIFNWSEGYMPLPPDAPVRSSRPRPAAQPVTHGVRPQAVQHPATKPTGGGTQARRQSQPRLAPAGSVANGTGLVLNKNVQVVYNAAYYGVGGVSNAGTAQINFANISNNYGGAVGGAHSGDFNDNAIDQTAFSSSVIKGNVAGYYSYSDSFEVGGLMIESILTTLNNTPVTGNTYIYNPGGAAGGIGLYVDGDETWATKVKLTSSPVTGNTPPQCASVHDGSGGTPPC